MRYENIRVYPELRVIAGPNVPNYQGLFLRGQGGNSAAMGVQQGDATRNYDGKGYIWSGHAGHLEASGAFKYVGGWGINSPAASWGGRQVRLLTPADLLEFVEEQVARGLARSTINRRISILRSAINWARNVGLLSSNPLSDLRLPRAQPSRLTPPTPFECMKILKHASPHVQRVVFLGLYTGARIGPCELFRLTWDDVDFKAGVIHMPSAKKGARIERRSIPIRKELLAHLKAWKVEDLKKNCRFVIHWGRKPIKNISGGWGAALKKAGIIRRIRPYDLRHAYATYSLSAGADIGAVAEIMGHRNVSMLLNIYQHVFEKQKRKAIEKLPNIFGQGQEVWGLCEPTLPKSGHIKTTP